MAPIMLRHKAFSSAGPFRGRAPTVVVRAEGPSGADADRRAMMISGMALGALLLAPADSLARSGPSALCTMQTDGDLADACRAAEIGKDLRGTTETYQQAESKQLIGNVVQGVPVAKLDSTYVKESEDLIALINAYCEFPGFTKEKIILVKDLKASSLAWVAKYARGGSARTQSARKLYIAVDSVTGFLVSNGMAPYPAAKIKSTEVAIAAARKFLDEGK
ncbi:hypothetical protein FOA52_007941 [Chlamydomonas sp. UWO 241]|nr:hypothetical protein FOA52_007941 [Chlamydomonas sp. UWO 241]